MKASSLLVLCDGRCIWSSSDSSSCILGTVQRIRWANELAARSGFLGDVSSRAAVPTLEAKTYLSNIFSASTATGSTTCHALQGRRLHMW